MTTLVWFHNDLRLEDNPALLAALDRGEPIVPIFIWAPEEEGNWPPGSASRGWLHFSLRALSADLETLGSRLILCRGPTRDTLLTLAQDLPARAVVWNRRYTPALWARDPEILAAVRQRGLDADSYKSGLIFEPWEVQNKQGRPFQIFTPFWNHYRSLPPPSPPDPAPVRLPAPATWPQSLPLEALNLEPNPDWTARMHEYWTPGEARARVRLETFLNTALIPYAEDRDRPDRPGTSTLSPSLHFGEISPRSIWHQVCQRAGSRDGYVEGMNAGPLAFLKALVWREFAHHLLYHFPHTTDHPLRPAFRLFPWLDDAGALTAWQKGQTGYPLVDAGMRQLQGLGWMHNRVRMVVASFLVKHLLLPWQVGARWFWDSLVDADLANNAFNWQWTAGCGADASPFFRIFNPVIQGKKFDPNGDYVRHWVPELSRLSARYLHAPWRAPPSVLREAGVVLGETYPQPIVEHHTARIRALEALASLGKTT